MTGQISGAAGGAGEAPRIRPLPGIEVLGANGLRFGNIHDLFTVYAGLGSGRLILLGAAGSGKTAAGILLLLEALSHRGTIDPGIRQQIPVPVLVSSHGWDPYAQRITDWLAGRLAHDYEFVGGVKGATRLIQEGHIALFLDGLDEMPAPVRATAIGALNDQATFRLVILTRSCELVEATQQGHLVGAAALELQPVGHREAADYLASCVVVPTPQPWVDLVAQLRAHRTGPVAEALTSPLIISLVRDTFPHPEDLTTVLLPGNQMNAGQIEDLILDRVVPVAYSPRSGEPPPPYTVEEAQHWLGYLAAHMLERGRRVSDLAWWELSGWHRQTSVSIVTAALWLYSSTIVAIVLSLGTGVAVGLVAGIPLAFFGLRANYHLVPHSRGRGRARFRESQYADRRTLRAPTNVAPLAIPFVALLFLMWFPATHQGDLRFAQIIFWGFILTPAYLVLGDAVLSKFSSLGREAPASANTQGPIAVWRRTWLTGIPAGLFIGLPIMLAFASFQMLAMSIDPRLATDLGVWLSPLPGIVAGVMVALTGPSTWSTWFAFLRIWWYGGGPVRMLKFLEDARARQVLRTSGPVYQFRHARLQDRLADTYERKHGPVVIQACQDPPAGPAFVYQR